MSEPVRLQRVLAAAGVASRRGAEELIAAGRVTIDGRIATLGERVEEGSVAITVDGRPIAPVTGEAVHLACHKPAGVTSTVRDRHATSTVIDLVPARLKPSTGRLVPVGRLDRDSEGLILLTSDGLWAERVLHPRYGVEREYAVGLRWPLRPEQIQALRGGVTLDEGIARLVRLRPQSTAETTALEHLVGRVEGRPLAWYRVVLRTGWKRQIRRMFATVGDPVARLVRVRVGAVQIGTLSPGSCRRLTRSEIEATASGVKLASRAGTTAERGRQRRA
ncbi:MAG TPA: pseudouridine synthase [Candidatus Limnocylindrales bacterium]|nr:pseudouridine synthase [Candidatus Limnocylindrales bacterium]